jgi:hypothetical protein
MCVSPIQVPRKSRLTGAVESGYFYEADGHTSARG